MDYIEIIDRDGLKIKMEVVNIFKLENKIDRYII